MRKNVRVITCDTTRKQLINQFKRLVSLDEFRELTDAQYSHNSLLAMRKDWNLFVEFCQRKQVCPLPASATAVRLFLERESSQRKYATLKRYAVTVSLVHKLLALSDPTSVTMVRTLMSKLRLDKKMDAHTTTAFTRQHLDKLTNTLSRSTSPVDVRNLAIYHLMFECMLKRMELKRLSLKDLYQGGSETALILSNDRYPLSQNAAHYLTKWLQVRGNNQGALFSAIDKHGNVSQNALDDSSIYRILRAASDRLKLDVNFSGQSLRVGAVAEMAARGVKVKDIQQYGRWQSAAMPYQYLGNRAQAAAERLIFKTFKPWG
ncbi:tyrosine-type recombinase/integrase [Vibrio sinaloensis]|uniref:tyrosine-type recombinase/integrase n=1 Tax=Photobacterium sp. (strain ATCC 43367) TaxID=379097 RepID=UPI00204C53B3|nr:tyrosine-type recombinase/integrase [Vibrio sinaloensis]UPQ89900.1 tyrosine-type recombinase/integrase [Vibrio sinaloensis]